MEAEAGSGNLEVEAEESSYTLKKRSSNTMTEKFVMRESGSGNLEVEV